MFPDKEEKKEFNLLHIKTGLLSTSEISILQAKKLIIEYSEEVYKMFLAVRKNLYITNNEDFENNLKSIEKFENYSDEMEVEIAHYLTKLSEGELSKLGSKRIRAMLKVIENLESAADSANNISKSFRRKRKQAAWFPPEVRNNLHQMFDYVDDSFLQMIKNLKGHFSKVDMDTAYKLEERVNLFRNKLKKEHLKNIENRNYKYQAGVIYNDIFSESEKMADYIINISEAINEVNQ